ncbi:MAG: hypothetical protein J1E64_11515 [Acetatifactor sp.]|nr:hypothetical protein [Acetatifactor sp.]
MKNWWYYHKWYVIVGVILLGVAADLIGSALGLFTKSPDLQIAYVGKAPLSQDTIDALQQAFTSLSGDYNHDGEVIVQINQYIGDSNTTDVDMAYYQYASEITLIGDISDCESYFFLLEDPQDFQRQYQLLARPDGSCPDETDYSIEDKIITWSNCPILSEMESVSELPADLSLGRRCFYTDTVTDNLQECSDLWEMLYHSTIDQ